MKIAFKNFLTTLRRYKTASVLNIAGLALAFAAFYAIMSQVWWEATYNRAIPHAGRTYAAAAMLFGDKPGCWIARPSMERTLAASPEVEAAAAVNWWGSGFGENFVWVRRTGALAPERFALDPDRAKSVTPGILDILPFRAVEGDLQAVGRPGTVILSRREAERLQAGVGSLLYVQQMEPTEALEVAAVFENLPDNSLGGTFDILHFMGDLGMADFGQWNTQYYIRLRAGATPATFVERWTAVDREVRQVGRENQESYTSMPVELSLAPLRGIYFNDSVQTVTEQGSTATTLTLLGIALLIVAIALINFVNFFLALLPVRLRAVNVQKVFGAPTRALRLNFLFEAVGYVVLALAGAWYLLLLIERSVLREYFPESLSLADNLVVAGIVGAAATAAVLAASLWPARHITSFSPVMAAKGYAASPAGRRLRTGLVAIQSFISQTLIVLTLVMWGQYRYMASADTGIASDDLFMAKLPTVLGCERRAAFAERLAAEPRIERLAFASRTLPVTNGRWNWGPTLQDGREATFALINCDTALLGVLGIGIVEGRDFTGDDWRKQGEAMIVNDCARRRYDLHPGDRFRDAEGREIVGVCHDFHYASMQYGVDALLFCLGNRPSYWLNTLYLRAAPGTDPADLQRRVGEAAHAAAPSVEASDIELQFFDRARDRAYARERRAATVVTLFGTMAVVISLMGVFGLVLFETQHRRREIAVRKVLGASTDEILRLLNRRYAAITLASFAAAAPAAWYFAREWLAAFAYRTGGIAWYFAGALLSVAAVTTATVTLRSLAAARANPAEATRSE